MDWAIGSYMQIRATLLSCAFSVLLVSPASAAILVTSSFGGISLKLQAFDASSDDSAYLWTGNPSDSAAVDGATVAGSGNYTYHGLTFVADTASISAAGFLDVQGEVSTIDAGFLAWDAPPTSWLIVGFETSTPYDYDFDISIDTNGSTRGGHGRLVQGYYYGTALSPSGLLPPGEYSLVFESTFKLSVSSPGTYHSRQSWTVDLTLTPALNLPNHEVPERDGFVSCVVALLVCACVWRRSPSTLARVSEVRDVL